ncbi:PAS domain-containing sensor histidine kinase [Bacteroidota bacterium]
MKAKRFYTNLIIRILLILINCFGIVYYLPFFGSDYRYTYISLSVILLIQLILLFRFFSKIISDLTKFLNSVRSNDTSDKFGNYKSNSILGNLHSVMNDVNQQIQELKINSTKQYYYLRNIVDHIGMGIITIKENNEVDICNSAAKNLLELKSVKSINDIEKKIVNSRFLLKNPEYGKSKLVQINSDNNQKQIFIVINEFRIGDEMVKIMSFQNVTDELAKKEIDSWQKLIRIITHEITNSMGPIVSLAKTMSKYFNLKKPEYIYDKDKQEEIFTKTRDGLYTIMETGEGMMNFINNYHKHSRLPDPIKTKIDIEYLFRKINNMFVEEFKINEIDFTFAIYPERLQILMDSNQIEQVLINLVKNSIESLNDYKKSEIKLQAMELPDGSPCITISDNGMGIQNDILDDIFIPFFSTKEKGSGIGLSLSRQIMRMHEGSISVISEPDVNTVFTLRF